MVYRAVGAKTEAYVVEVLHVAAGDKAGLVLNDGPGAIPIDLVFPRTTNNTREG